MLFVLYYFDDLLFQYQSWYKGCYKMKMVACEVKEIIDEVRSTKYEVLNIYDLRGTIYDWGSLYI